MGMLLRIRRYCSAQKQQIRAHIFTLYHIFTIYGSEKNGRKILTQKSGSNRHKISSSLQDEDCLIHILAMTIIAFLRPRLDGIIAVGNYRIAFLVYNHIVYNSTAFDCRR